MIEQVSGQESLRVLLVSAGGRVCALPLLELCETMRALPIEPLLGAPAFVLGVSLIRGVSVPVVDLAQLLGSEGRFSRFVTLKLEQGSAALAVSDVRGVAELDPDTLSELPPLVRDASADFIAALAAKDAHLHLLLRSARLVPDSVWPLLAPSRTSS